MTTPTKYQILLGIDYYLKGKNEVRFDRQTGKFTAGSSPEVQQIFQFETLEELGDNVTPDQFRTTEEPAGTQADTLFNLLSEDLRAGGRLDFDELTGWVRFYCAAQDLQASFGDHLLTALTNASKITIDQECVLQTSETALLWVEEQKQVNPQPADEENEPSKPSEPPKKLWDPALAAWKDTSLWSLSDAELDKLQAAANTANMAWSQNLTQARALMTKVSAYAAERMRGKEGRSTHFVIVPFGSWAEADHKTRSHFHRQLILADRFLAEGILQLWQNYAKKLGDTTLGTKTDRLEIWEILPSGHRKLVGEITGEASVGKSVTYRLGYRKLLADLSSAATS